MLAKGDCWAPGEGLPGLEPTALQVRQGFRRPALLQGLYHYSVPPSLPPPPPLHV